MDIDEAFPQVREACDGDGVFGEGGVAGRVGDRDEVGFVRSIFGFGWLGGGRGWVAVDWFESFCSLDIFWCKGVENAK